jgi:acyl dehydratase
VVRDGESMTTMIEKLRSRIGQEIGVSEWKLIDQARIDAHAETTGDRDWLHNDPERARRESPFGRTIAQGTLLVGLLSGFLEELNPLGSDLDYGLNYGFDRIRFLRPTLVDVRVRARFRMKDVRSKQEKSFVVTLEAWIEQEGESEPLLYAEWLAMAITR